jgi:hypothetical protein
MRTCPFARTDCASCGSRHALRWSWAHSVSCKPWRVTQRLPPTKPRLRVGAVFSLALLAYLNSLIGSTLKRLEKKGRPIGFRQPRSLRARSAFPNCDQIGPICRMIVS